MYLRWIDKYAYIYPVLLVLPQLIFILLYIGFMIYFLIIQPMLLSITVIKKTINWSVSLAKLIKMSSSIMI